MDKIIYPLALYLILIINCLMQAQEFAPIQLGNVWVYEFNNGTRYRSEIIDSSVMIDSIKYFGYGLNYNTQYSKIIRLRNDDFYVIKEDSTFPEPLNERIYYKKNAKLWDTWDVNQVVYTITDTFPAYTFDTLVTGKLLNENFGLVEWDYVWIEEFGKLAMMDWQGEVKHYLRGCVINGKVYGDTTFIISGINDINYEMSYKLYNNYPNPFNSSTVIRFTIPESDYVLLEVYNSLGEKIKTLVNEFTNAGDHTIQFEANNLASGVYLYVLRTSGYMQTKKMLLIR